MPARVNLLKEAWATSWLVPALGVNPGPGEPVGLCFFSLTAWTENLSITGVRVGVLE